MGRRSKRLKVGTPVFITQALTLNGPSPDNASYRSCTTVSESDPKTAMFAGWILVLLLSSLRDRPQNVYKKRSLYEDRYRDPRRIQ
jgi:hypothetical protein